MHIQDLKVQGVILPGSLPGLFGQHGSRDPVVYGKFVQMEPTKIIFYVLEGSARSGDFGLYCYRHSAKGGTCTFEKLSILSKLPWVTTSDPSFLRKCVNEDFGQEINLPILY